MLHLISQYVTSLYTALRHIRSNNIKIDYTEKDLKKLGSGTRYTVQYSQSKDLIRDLGSDSKLWGDLC